MGIQQARNRRDIGIAAVVEHNTSFCDLGEFYVRKHLAGQEVTGDEIHSWLEAIGVQPDHHNAWGGFVSGLVRRGVLEDTGRSRHASRVSRHAGRLPVWRVKSISN